MLIAPAPTGEPVSTVLIGVLAGIASLWRLFSGGVTAALKRALEGIRGVIATVADGLMRYAWQIARALGRVLQGLHTIWVRVIAPVLRQLPRLAARVRRLIERDLPRLLALINRIRERLLEIYERHMRPILEMIQRIRRALLILRLLRIRWAERLDARLSALQGRIMTPLAVALAHIAWVEQWINLILSYEHVIQESIWTRSLWSYQGDLVRTWWAAHGPPLDPLREWQIYGGTAEQPPERTYQEVRDCLRTNSGPLAPAVEAARRELRAHLLLGGA